MSTVEHEWADQHPNGQVWVKAGPVFVFWNFGVNESHLKPRHISFMMEVEFSNFLVRNINLGRTIQVAGLSSVSTGNSAVNRRLAQERANNTMLQICRRALILRQQGRIDSTIDDRTIGRLIVSSVAPASEENTFYDVRGGLRIPASDGQNMAFNRAANVFTAQSGRLDRNQVEVIGRSYLRTNLLSLPMDFPFWDMWYPDWHSYKRTIPATINRGDGIGTRIPPNRNWSMYQTSFEALRAAEVDAIRLSDQLNRFFYSADEVISQIEFFLSEGEIVKGRVEAEEQHVTNTFNFQAGFGSIPSIEDINRYVVFRNATIIDRLDSLLRYNGFRPRLRP